MKIKNSDAVNYAADQRRAKRDAHFEHGDCAMWIGRSVRFKQEKQEASRNGCRNKRLWPSED